MQSGEIHALAAFTADTQCIRGWMDPRAGLNMVVKRKNPQESNPSHLACSLVITEQLKLRGCIQKFPDWPPGARTANGVAPCHYVQLYHYFVSV
jgi:hypothetical protein